MNFNILISQFKLPFRRNQWQNNFPHKRIRIFFLSSQEVVNFMKHKKLKLVTNPNIVMHSSSKNLIMTKPKRNGEIYRGGPKGVLSVTRFKKKKFQLLKTQRKKLCVINISMEILI